MPPSKNTHEHHLIHHHRHRLECAGQRQLSRHRARVFENNFPGEWRYPQRRLRWAEIGHWYLTLSKQGWVAPSWPTPYGGMGLTPEKLIIFIEEQERWGVARTPDMGITMVGPLLINHGNEAQRAYYLPKIIAGEHIWCQGYSEPNSGSDLASLRTEAVVDGDDFIVNGQKIWTTLAQDATHIFLLVRTDKSAKKQEGISFLLADMKTPGITVRPIRNIAGGEDFCEVFLENVRVPRSSIVGELNKGWTIAKALLGFERIFLGSPKQSQYALARVQEAAQRLGLFEDSGFVTATPSWRWMWPTWARSMAASSIRSSAAKPWGPMSPCSSCSAPKPIRAWPICWSMSWDRVAARPAPPPCPAARPMR